MAYSFLNKLLFNYEKGDDDDEEERENLTQSCSDGEGDSEEVSVSIGTPKETEPGKMRCKLRPTSGRIYFFRPSLLNFMFLLIFIFLVYHWIFSKIDKIQDLRRRPIEDAFNRRITLFMSGLGRNTNFTVFKRQTLERGIGDFSCSSSIRQSKCAFRVGNLTQATQICKVYGDACKGFVLTQEKIGLVIYLKHEVIRVHKSNHSALFVKTCFVPKEGFELMTDTVYQ